MAALLIVQYFNTWTLIVSAPLGFCLEFVGDYEKIFSELRPDLVLAPKDKLF